MRGSKNVMRFILALPLFALVAGHGLSAQVVSTTARGVGAVMQHNGFQLVPTGSPGQFGGDLAPVQSFQIVRPGNQRVTIGRLFTSCTCVRLESPKQTYEAGETAVLHLRNVRPTPPSGQIYAIYVQIISPIRTTLRFDTFVQSSQFIPAGVGEAPTRADIVIDGVLSSVPEPARTETVVTKTGGVATMVKGDDGIEIIVPTADHYIEDTSEYTMRKKAELDTAKSSVRESEKEEEVADKSPAAADDAETKAVAEKQDDLWRPAIKKSKSLEAKVADAAKTADDAADALAEKADAAKEEIAEKAAEVKEEVAEKIAEAEETLTEKAAAIRDEAAEAVADAMEEGQKEAAAVKDAVVEKAEEIGERAEEVEDAVAEKIEAAKADAAEMLAGTDEELAEAADEAEEAVQEKADAVDAIADDAEEEMDAVIDEFSEEFEARAE